MTNKFPEHRLKEGLNVLSLFDGMGCAWEVLERLEIKVANAYSSEIDKFANIANHNAHPYVIPLGDVRGVHAKDLPSIDFVSAGSPCQGFSFAGKQLKFDDPRSALFWEFVRILEEVKKKNPNVIFLLENVGMDKESELVISKAMGINPVFINSSLVSAQNRERNYWTNIGAVRAGFFDDVVPGIQQPKDRGIFLKDILQPPVEVGEKYYLSEKRQKVMFERIGKFTQVNGYKSYCLTARANASWHGDIISVPTDEITKLDVKGNPKPNQQKAGCLTGGGHSAGNHSDMDIIAIIQQGRGYNKGGEFSDKSPPITSNSWEHNHTLTQDFKFRRLTVIECLRLQGIRDNFFLNENEKQVVSDSQAYKMLGNGWQCDTIEYIVKHAIK